MITNNQMLPAVQLSRPMSEPSTGGPVSTPSPEPTATNASARPASWTTGIVSGASVNTKVGKNVLPSRKKEPSRKPPSALSRRDVYDAAL